MFYLVFMMILLYMFKTRIPGNILFEGCKISFQIIHCEVCTGCEVFCGEGLTAAIDSAMECWSVEDRTFLVGSGSDL